MDGISRSRGWDKEIRHCVLPMEQLVLSDKWARKIESIIGVQLGQKNPNPRAHRSSGKRGLPSFQLNGGPKGWDLSGTTEHQ